MTDPAQLLMWMRPGLTCPPESRGLMSQSHQPEQLCSNTPGMLAYQSGCVWAQATQCQKQWAMQTGDMAEWQVFWTANSPIAKSCEQLTKCGFKSGCRGRCKCYKLGLVCSLQLCSIAYVRCNTRVYLIFLLSQAVKVLGFIDQKHVHVAKTWLLQVNGSHLGYHLAFRMLCYNHTENRGL